jgi:hypothetical protein
MMGLESSTLRGVAAVSILDFEESSDFGTCAQEPNTQVSGVTYSYTAAAFFLKMFVVFRFLPRKIYKMASDAFQIQKL